MWTIIVVYAPIAHWVWEPNGWLAKSWRALDFAGGSVVHVNAGIAGLVVCLLCSAHAAVMVSEPFERLSISA
jgi:Amt family ammonium transporter